VLSGVSPRICPRASLIYLLLSFAVLLSTQNIILFADTIKIAASVSSATDSTLPQSDIDSIRGRCTVEFVKLNTDETKVRSTMVTTYCLNQTKRWDSYVLSPTLLLLLIVPYCYITP
jgi:hypothetical protein